MKLTIILISLSLFIGTSVLAQVNANYFMTKKGQKEYVIKKKSNIIDKFLKSYGFIYNDSNGAYESSYLSWHHQYFIKVKKKRIVLEFYGTPIEVKYADSKNAYNIFKAFNDAIRWSVKNDQLIPTVPNALWGWKSRLKYGNK